MTILQRAATIAVMTFTIAGLVGHSSPVLANGLDTVATTYATSAINTPDLPMVPQTAAFQSETPDLTTAEPDTGSFDSLADAVAAQDAAAASDSVRCLAGAVYFESRGEPLSGQLAVAQVILNRTRSGRFPPDVCAVVTQRSQFSFVRGGRIPTVDANRADYRTAMAVAKVAISEAWNSVAPQALYFNTSGNRPGGRMTRIAAIGNHIFYR